MINAAFSHDIDKREAVNDLNLHDNQYYPVIYTQWWFTKIKI